MDVKNGDNVLCLWKNNINTSVIEEIRGKVGDSGKVQLENLEQLVTSSHEPSVFDVAIYGFASEESQMLSENCLNEVLRTLKPAGMLFIKKSTKEDCKSQELVTSLKFSGFVNVEESPDVLKASKPDYELGSSVKLNFKDNGPSESAVKLWEMEAEAHEHGVETELIKDSDLLDESDLKKPDPESLRVCGTTGKRKACANCSCGLAEELEKAEIENIRKNTQTAKSSCGSCYLGDAFRCASCPYLGMPAFKPGEKVVIDTSSDL